MVVRAEGAQERVGGAESVGSEGTTSSSVTPPLRIRVLVTHRDIGVEVHVDADYDQDHGCGECVDGNGHISRVMGLTRGAAGWNGRARGGADLEAGAWPSARAAAH